LIQLFLNPNKAGLIIILIALAILAFCAPSYAARSESNLFWNEEYETLHDDCEAYHETVIASIPEKLKLVKRIAEVIHRYKIRHDRPHGWIECGKRIKNETQSLARALTYALHIFDSSEKVRD